MHRRGARLTRPSAAARYVARDLGCAAVFAQVCHYMIQPLYGGAKGLVMLYSCAAVFAQYKFGLANEQSSTSRKLRGSRGR